MKKINFLVSITLIVSLRVLGQNWTYANWLNGPFYDYAYDIASDTLGNYYLVGEFDSWYILNNDTVSSYANKDGFLVKFSPNGNVLKKMKVGSSNNYSGIEERITCVAVDKSMNVYIAGYGNTDNFMIGSHSLNLTSNKKGFIAKLDSSFNTIWTRTASCYVSPPEKILIDQDENIYVIGRFPCSGGSYLFDTLICSSGIDDNKVLRVFKLDPNGNLIWYKSLGKSTYANELFDADVDQNGDLYICGTFYGKQNFDSDTLHYNPINYSQNPDAFVAKLSKTDGSVQWARAVGSISEDIFNAICVHPSGSVFVGGKFGAYSDYEISVIKIGNDSIVSYTSNSSDAILFKFDLNGNLIWMKSFKSYGEEGIKFILKDNNGNIVVGGDYSSGSGNFGGLPFSGGSHNIFLSVIDTITGNPISINKGGGTYNTDNLKGMILGKNNAIAVCGNYDKTSEFGSYTLPPITTYGQQYTSVFFAVTTLSTTSTHLDNNTSVIDVVNLFPNPSSGTFTLQTQQGGVFELMDITGRVLNTYIINNTNETIQTNLPSGMYFIREKGSGVAKKLIIE
jgi:hypothetical protein